MKSIMLSVRPKWFTKIAVKEKTLELRHTYPKELDGENSVAEVFIYCGSVKRMNMADYVTALAKSGGRIDVWQGRVAARFLLRQVYKSKYINGLLGDSGWQLNICPYHDGLNRDGVEKLTGMSYSEAEKYAGTKTLYLWKIEELTIFQKPLELKEFGLKRPPQSWQYINNSPCLAPTQQELEDFWNNK